MFKFKAGDKVVYIGRPLLNCVIKSQINNGDVGNLYIVNFGDSCGAATEKSLELVNPVTSKTLWDI